VQLIAILANEMEAVMLQNDLAAHDIESSVQGQTLGAARGEIPLTQQTLPQIWVREEDYDRAAAIAEAFFTRLRTPASEAGAWTCPHCGAHVDVHFEICWNCGRNRPDVSPHLT